MARPDDAVIKLHASAVAIDGLAVVLRGPSGSGKSSLALRLIDAGAALVADDRTHIMSVDGQPVAAAPDRLRGLIEIRGFGIVAMEAAGPTPVGLLVDLAPTESIARLPDAHELAEDLFGRAIARVGIDPGRPEAAAKIRAIVKAVGAVPAGASGHLVWRLQKC